MNDFTFYHKKNKRVKLKVRKESNLYISYRSTNDHIWILSVLSFEQQSHFNDKWIPYWSIFMILHNHNIKLHKKT